MTPKIIIILSCLLFSHVASALDDTNEIEDADQWEDETLFSELDVSGFIEMRSGVRLQDDAKQKAQSINELRYKIELEREFDNFTFNLNSDFIYDGVVDKQSLNLRKGEGFVDLRELHVSFSPSAISDIKVGRQILTWGTGDLVFINDLFAKDWRSFFSGRDTQYLKAPSDALKTSLYFNAINIDFVYIPKFNPDRYIDGQRLSYFNSNASTQPIQAEFPQHNLDDELAIRAYKNFSSLEAALYFYDGYTKSPAGYNSNNGKVTFPKLQVYGASIRAPLAKGIFNAEIGYRDINASEQAHLINNKTDEWRVLVGYEQEIAKELTAAMQYYVEIKKDKTNRHLTTLRLQKQLMQQKLLLSAFSFYSPAEKDGYLRLNSSYKYSDALKIELGANYFFGADADAFFTQFNNNSNVYGALKYSF